MGDQGRDEEPAEGRAQGEHPDTEKQPREELVLAGRLVTQGPGAVFFAWFLDEGGVHTYRDHLRADTGKYARFAEQMLHRGVRLIPAGRWYLTNAHDQEAVDRTLEAAENVLRRLAP